MNSWFGASWNKSVKKEAHSFKYGFGINSSFGKNKGFTNGQLYGANPFRLIPRVNLTYDYGELLSITPTYNLSWQNTIYSNYIIDKALAVQHKFNLQFTSYWPKHVVFGTDLWYTYNSNIADGFKKDFYLLNVSLGYNFFKQVACKSQSVWFAWSEPKHFKNYLCNLYPWWREHCFDAIPYVFAHL